MLNTSRGDVPLVDVDVSDAFFQQVDLNGADLLRANFRSADSRGGSFAIASGRPPVGTCTPSSRLPGDPTTFRAHERSWVLPSITMFLMKHINEYNFLLTRKLLNEYGEH